MKKTRLFTLLAVMLLCVRMSAYDFSAVATYVEEPLTYEVTLYYSINSDGMTVTVTKGPSAYDADIVSIPETVEWNGNTYTVTTIGYQAFESSDLGIVLMANTIIEVQDYAFKSSGVDSVRFSTNLKTIGDYAFNGAEQLTSVVLHEGLESIGAYAFQTGGYYNNPGLHRVSLPNSLADIGERAFAYQIKLNEVTLPEGLKELKTGTFQYCPGLKGIVLPESLEVIGANAFSESGLQTVNFPSSLKEIGKDAFSKCSLLEVILPDNIVTLGEYAFSQNRQMTSISFSKGMKVLPKDVCSYCEQLVDVKIPEGIETIEYGAFSYCSRLSHVTLPESVVGLGDAIFMSSGIVAFEFPKNISTVPTGMFRSCNYLSEISMPSTITKIGNGAFEDCENLSVVNLSESVTSIERSAFDGCKSLKEITLPAKLNFIGQRAFGDCDSLEKIEVPSKVNKIEQYAFANCDLLEEIIIPHETAIVGQYMLSGCPNLTEVHYQRAILPGIDGGANYPKIVDDNNETTLYVPRGAKATFEESSVWNNFMAIVEEDVPNVYYELSAKVAKGKGSVTVDEENIAYNKVDTLLNSAVTVTFTPAEGYMIETVLCNGEDITAELGEALQYEIASVEANYQFEVYYKEKPVTLHLVSGQGGSIELLIEKGSCFTCNFKEEEGWRVNTLLFNGGDVTAEWSATDGYTTPMITGESTLSVSFELVNSVANQTISRLKAYSREEGVLTIEGLTAGEQVYIYSAEGKLETSFNSSSSTVKVSLPTDAIYVVNTANGTVKVGM